MSKMLKQDWQMTKGFKNQVPERKKTNENKNTNTDSHSFEIQNRSRKQGEVPDPGSKLSDPPC